MTVKGKSYKKQKLSLRESISGEGHKFLRQLVRRVLIITTDIFQPLSITSFL